MITVGNRDNAAKSEAGKGKLYPTFRYDLLISFSWLAMDASWAFLSLELATVFGLIAIAASLIPPFIVKARADRVLYAACALWVTLDEANLLCELYPTVGAWHVGDVLAAATTVAMIASQILHARDDARKIPICEYCAFLNMFAWFAMDVAWSMGLTDATFALAAVTLLTGVVNIVRSENKAVGMVNAAMFFWVVLNMAELAAETGVGPIAVACVTPVSLLMVLVLLLGAMAVSRFDFNVLTAFCRVRLSAHAKAIDTMSFMPPSNMAISVVREGNITEMRMEGRLDVLTVDRFMRTVSDLAGAGHVDIRLDASGVDYISSSGLRALLQVHKQLHSLNGSFKIDKASSNAMQIIFMAGFGGLLDKD